MTNSNVRIVKNSIFLYGHLFIAAICGIFSTRYALQALGTIDYGLFAVLGGIISFVSILNTIFISTCNRFITVAIGKGNIEEINRQFNINLVIHILIAGLTAIVALPIGTYYVLTVLNYEGNIDNALWLFYLSFGGAIISFISVPYNGLLMAKEKFSVFSFVGIVSSILKLIVSYLLVYYFSDKLLVYGLMLFVITISPLFIYYLYCKKYYCDIVQWKRVTDIDQYKAIFAFSGWVAYGAIATIAKSQGAAVLVNLFFNTIMNTALGVANTINTYILQFAHNITTPIAPQITKNFSTGNMDRCNNLMITSSKLSFLFMLLIASPFIVESEWIIQLWLGTVPEYSVIFLLLMIVDSLVDSLNAGIKELIYASGVIKMFQIVVNTIKFISVLGAYFYLKQGLPPYGVFYVYIAFSILAFFSRQIILNRTLNFDNMLLIKKAYLPSLSVAILFMPAIGMRGLFHPIINIFLTLIYLALLIYVIALTKQERSIIMSLFKKNI